ncbi:MAG: hypothetical protein B7733_02800 [Myxococcales bacterium FL481]|nr:MAG: hypothetical protein B7733_02800 [Myxococcales bacterium FL481]
MATYAALTYGSARQAGLILGAVFIPMAIARVRRLPRDHRRSLAVVPLLIAACTAAATVANRSAYLLYAPVATNLTLGLGFAFTLFGSRTPMIEHFARLQVRNLGPAERTWCRQWTVVWSVFLFVNASVAGALASFAPANWWALYNGLFAYVAMGGLFTTEYVWRKLRFGRFASHAPDQWLARLARRRSAEP